MMSEKYNVRKYPGDKPGDVAGYTIHGGPGEYANAVFLIGADDDLPVLLIFEKRHVAEDFAAALNLGAKARQSEGER